MRLTFFSSCPGGTSKTGHGFLLLTYTPSVRQGHKERLLSLGEWQETDVVPFPIQDLGMCSGPTKEVSSTSSLFLEQRSVLSSCPDETPLIGYGILLLTCTYEAGSQRGRPLSLENGQRTDVIASPIQGSGMCGGPASEVSSASLLLARSEYRGDGLHKLLLRMDNLLVHC